MAIHASITDGVARLVLDRPEKRNAFDDQTIADISSVLSLWRHDESIRVLVISANGETFCAGADLGWMKRTAQLDHQANLEDAQKLAIMMDLIDSFPVPVLTLVQGAAFGGALGIICCSDIVLATEDAKFCLSEVRLGIVPAVISPYVIRAMGERQARRYMLTAERFDAGQALNFNLVHQLFSTQEEVVEAGKSLITTLSLNGPQAMRQCKQLIADVSGKPIDEPLMRHTSQFIADIRNTSEGQEGLAAFLEKRKPNWITAESGHQ
ncbi:enoyl-CoA hydratase-related protein [Parendozoicomonas haliclonae]|uniref:Carnitinyl-CoA dehydratase n=1 Tax=Parendozoicomonas haliclonae TaxID=1960125 RepID=A0A1X7AKL7_9GAMM|nr:enoyl-CoA hydratase-related protein [Parendozoicomonas haliclonae]SMA47884.1 Carnitinyl-CoA dehydratase [Parendozoicomonas haliclonae]